MSSTKQGLMLGSLLLISVCVGAAAMFGSSLDAHWALWKKTHGKMYQNEMEDAHRRELWERNLMLITTHNLEASMGLHTYELGMNHMGDLTQEEILQSFAALTPPTHIQRAPSPFAGASGSDVPDTMDWRDKGCVTKVKMQDEACKYNPMNRAANCSSYHFLPEGDENALKQALATIGPISVGIDAKHPRFTFYRSRSIA